MEQIISEGLSRIESNVLNHDKLLGLLSATESKPKEPEPVVIPTPTVLPLPSKKIEIGIRFQSNQFLTFSSHSTTNSFRKGLLGLHQCL